MQRHSASPRHPPRLRLVALALGLAGANAAHAEADPYYIGVSQGFTHDSNVTRGDRESNIRSDSISSTGLVAGIDQPIGRQRLYGSGNVNVNKFSNVKSLDNTSYTLKAGLDFATIERVSGNVYYTTDKSLIQSAVVSGGAPSLEKFTQRSTDFGATVRVGVVTKLTFEGIYQHQTLDYTGGDEFTNLRGLDLRKDVYSLGVRYTPSGLINGGLAWRHTRGEYPDSQAARFVSDDFKRDDLDLTLNWLPSALTTIESRLSYTRKTAAAFTSRDFSGVTGVLTVHYRPTGKLTFTGAYIRDVGTEASFLREAADALAQTGDYSRVTNKLRLGVTYDMTAKIQATASASYARRSLDNFLQSGNGLSGDDNTTVASIGLQYVPTRSLQFNCSVSRDARSVSGNVANATGVLTRPYASNAVFCGGQLVLR